MTNWAEIVAAVPATVWGVLLGSSITFVGVGRQLRHDARQRDRERLMQLRRDVYLEAADGMAGTAEQFFRLANAEIPLSQLSTLPELPGWLNKVYTVGSLDTIVAFSDASTALGAALFDLLKTRLQVEQVTAEIDAANTEIASITNLQQQLQTEAASLASQPPAAAVNQRQQIVGGLWAKSVQDLDASKVALSDLWDKKLTLARGLLEQAVNHFLEYQHKLHGARLALRSELELPLDVSEYRSAMERSEKIVLSKFRQVLASITSDTPSK